MSQTGTLPDKQALLALAGEVDRAEKEFREKQFKLEEIREQAQKSEGQELVEYEDPSTGFVITVENLGEDGEQFLAGLMGKHVLITHRTDTGYLLEGFFEHFEAGAALGYFRQKVGDSTVFGRVRGYRFDGFLQSYSQGRKLLTRTGEPGQPVFSKLTEDFQYDLYGYCLEGEFVDGEVLVRTEDTEVFTRMVQKKFCGHSEVVKKSGARFEGELEGLAYKTGRLAYDRDELVVYEGEFDSQQRPHGRGRLKNHNLVYEGTFEQGLLQGDCSYTDAATGERFEGFFQNNAIVGRGVHEFPGKFRYEGEFKEGKYHGQGVFVYENGSAFEGEFREGRFEGFGKIITTQGDILEGQFADWNPAGELKMKNSKGKEYKGNFKEGPSDGISLGGQQQRVDFSGDISEMVKRDFESQKEECGHDPHLQNGSKNLFAAYPITGRSLSNLVARSTENWGLQSACLRLPQLMSRRLKPKLALGFLLVLQFGMHLRSQA